MRHFGKQLILTAVFALGVTGLAVAQEDPNFGPTPEVVAPPPMSQDAQGAFGIQPQELWIAAPQFNGRWDTSAGDLVYSGYHYYSNSVAASGQYFAPLDLPSGAVVTLIQCHVNGTVGIALQRYWFDITTFEPGGVFVASFSSAGTGYQTAMSNALEETILHNEGNRRNLWYLRATLSNTTGLRACRIVWHRSVSAAPATATFPVDVPTTHPFFRFVEALASAGITSGCGSGTYCVNQPVTRGQMAVFLAVALGLHFPK